jgi:hypothetical protein
MKRTLVSLFPTNPFFSNIVTESLATPISVLNSKIMKEGQKKEKMVLEEQGQPSHH